MNDHSLLFRVPLASPLTRTELTIAALLAEGWDLGETARMLGVAIRTVQFHLGNMARKIPGDLPRVSRAVAWYRGAPFSVLVPSRMGAYDEKDVPATMTRQGALHRAQSISQGRGCPCCGYSGVVLAARPPKAKDELGHFAATGQTQHGNGTSEFQGQSRGDG